MNKLTESIDPQVRQGLEQLLVVPPRDPQATARGRAQFLAQAEMLSQDISRTNITYRIRWGELIHNLFVRKERFAMGTMMTVFLVVSLALSGVGAAVYVAQDDLPTQPFYGVKTLSEDVRLGLTGDPEVQIALSLEFANRRMGEIRSLSDKDITPPDLVATRLQAQLDQALHVAAGLDDAGLNQALIQAQATIEQQTQRIAQVQYQAPEQAQPVLARVQVMLAERNELTQMGLADPQAFRQHQRTRGGEPKPTPIHTPGSRIVPTPGLSLTVTPGDPWEPGPGISLTVTPGAPWGPGPGVSQTVTPGRGFGPGPGISLTVTPGDPWGPGPGVSQTVTPGRGFGPGPGISLTVTPGRGYGPGPQPTPEPGGGNGNGNGNGGNVQPTSEPGGGGDPQPTLEPGGGDGNGNGGNVQPTPEPGGGGDPQPTPEPGSGNGNGNGSNAQPTPEPGGGGNGNGSGGGGKP